MAMEISPPRNSLTLFGVVAVVARVCPWQDTAGLPRKIGNLNFLFDVLILRGTFLQAFQPSSKLPFPFTSEKQWSIALPTKQRPLGG